MLGSSLIGEDGMGRVHVQDTCSQGWSDSCLVGKGAACLVGTSRESSRKVLVFTFPLKAAVSFRAAPALLLTHPAQFTGTIHQ